MSADDSEGKSQGHAQDHGPEGQLQRDGEAGLQLIADGGLRHVGPPDVAFEGGLVTVATELDEKGVVQAVVDAELFHRLRGRVLAQGHSGGVAGGDVEEREDDQRDSRKHGNEHQKSAQRVL